jgi:hypothetical protein
MAVPSNTYQTYTVVGAKEEIADVISNISPTKTPFQSDIGSDKVSQKLFQWQEDSLRAQGQNAAIEGDDASARSSTPTVMRTNVTQILTETVQVAGTTDATATYGRAKESAYQMAKTAAQLKRDLEFVLVGTGQGLSTGGGVVGSSSAPRYMQGYQGQIAGVTWNTGSTPNVVEPTAIGAAGVPSNVAGQYWTVLTEGTVTNPLVGATLELAILGAMQGLFTAGGDPTTVSLHPTRAIQMADIAKGATGSSNRIRDFGDGKTVVNVVEVYVSPFGKIKVVLNRFQLRRPNITISATARVLTDTLVYDPDNWMKSVLRPWQRETLAKTGDSVKIQMLSEQSLKHKNFNASALITDIYNGTV